MDQLFALDSDADPSSTIKVEVGVHQVELELPPDEHNSDKKTLFATYLWNGAISLAEELLVRVSQIKGKRVLELGAAAGLPSIIVGKMSPLFLCASDYPSPSVLDTLKKNLERNRVSGHVVGHIWGETVSPLLEKLNGEKYDVIVASECLWRHECHNDLLETVIHCIARKGIFILSYSHHIPGLEEEDDLFIKKALTKSFVQLEEKTIEIKSQWNPDKTKLLYFVVLSYTGNPV
jgi:nicotinamide N-methyltransferase